MPKPPPHPSTAMAERLVLDAVRRNPGIGIRALQRATGLSLATVQKRVKTLRRARRLRTVRSGGRLACLLTGEALPPEPLPPPLARLLAILAVNGPMREVEFLELNAPTPRSTTQHRLQRLVELGLVRARPSKRFAAYRR